MPAWELKNSIKIWKLRRYKTITGVVQFLRICLEDFYHPVENCISFQFKVSTKLPTFVLCCQEQVHPDREYWNNSKEKKGTKQYWKLAAGMQET